MLSLTSAYRLYFSLFVLLSIRSRIWLYIWICIETYYSYRIDLVISTYTQRWHCFLFLDRIWKNENILSFSACDLGKFEFSSIRKYNSNWPFAFQGSLVLLPNHFSLKARKIATASGANLAKSLWNFSIDEYLLNTTHFCFLSAMTLYAAKSSIKVTDGMRMLKTANPRPSHYPQVFYLITLYCLVSLPCGTRRVPSCRFPSASNYTRHQSQIRHYGCTTLQLTVARAGLAMRVVPPCPNEVEGDNLRYCLYLLLFYILIY